MSEERWAVHQLAATQWQQGQPDAARAGYTRALALAEQLGDLSAQRIELDNLATLYRNLGRFAEAQDGYEQALILAKQLGDPSAEAAELRGLGGLLVDLGERDQGRTVLLQALATFERLSAVEDVADCHLYLARRERAAGNIAEAIVHYGEALRGYVQIGSPDAEEAREALEELGAGE